MPSVLVAKWRTTPVANFIAVGATLSQVGGDLDRELAIAVSNGDSHGMTSLIRNFNGNVHRIHGPRIYRFYGSALHATAGTFSGGFTFLKDGAWTASDGSAGTFIEAYVGTEAFIKVLVTSGSLTNGATVTVTVGGHTCVLTSLPVGRGATGEKGEWGVVHTLPTLKSPKAISGIAHAIAGGDMRQTGLFVDSSNALRLWFWNPLTDVFSESAALLTNATLVELGRIASHGDSVISIGYWDTLTAGNTNDTYIVNVNTLVVDDAPEVITGSQTGAPVGSLLRTIVSLSGRLFQSSWWSSPANAAQLFLRERVGSTWATVLLTGLTTQPTQRRPAFGRHGECAFVRDDALYFFLPLQSSGGVHGWDFIRCHLDNAGAFVADTWKNVAAEDEFTNLVLPADKACQPSVSQSTLSVWSVEIDQQTNSPDGADIFTFRNFNPKSVGGGVATYDWPGFIDLTGIALTWDGTTTIVTDVDPVGIIAVGDWVGLKVDRGVFRVTALDSIAPFGVTIEQLAAPTGSGLRPVIPTGTGTAIIHGTAQAMTLSSTPVAGSLSFPDGNSGDSGGSKFFVKGQKGIEIVSIEPASGGMKITYVPYGGGVQVIRFYVGETNSEVASKQLILKSASEGSIVADGGASKLTGVTIDGSQKTVEIELIANGLADTETRKFIPEIADS